jgi:hypothetical protein
VAEKTLAVTGVRLSAAERAGLERLARQSDRTTSREIRRAVRFYLGNIDKADRFLRARAETTKGGSDPDKT